MLYFNTSIAFLTGWLFFALYHGFLEEYPRLVNEFLYPLIGLIFLFIAPLVMQSREQYKRAWLIAPLAAFGAGFLPVWLGLY